MRSGDGGERKQMNGGSVGVTGNINGCQRQHRKQSKFICNSPPTLNDFGQINSFSAFRAQKIRNRPDRLTELKVHQRKDEMLENARWRRWQMSS